MHKLGPVMALTRNEAAIAAAPDVLLIAAIEQSGAHHSKQIWQKPGLSGTPALQQQRIIFMDPLYLLGF